MLLQQPSLERWQKNCCELEQRVSIHGLRTATAAVPMCSSDAPSLFLEDTQLPGFLTVIPKGIPKPSWLKDGSKKDSSAGNNSFQITAAWNRPPSTGETTGSSAGFWICKRTLRLQSIKRIIAECLVPSPRCQHILSKGQESTRTGAPYRRFPCKTN